MTSLDWIIAGVYFIGTIIFGVYLNQKTQNTKAFFSGGKNFAWWAVAGSVISTQVSAVTFVGAPGWAYTDGLAPIVLSLNIPVVMWFISANIVPFFYNSGVVSIYEYMEGRFGYAARATMAAAFIVKLLGIMGVVIYAPALVLSYVTGIDIVLTILIMTVAIFVTSFGGLTAAIWIDVIQISILWLGIIVSFIIVLIKLPVSLPEAFTILEKAGKLKALSFSTDLSASNTFWGGMIGGLVLHVSYFGANQAQVQRMLAARSIRNLKLSLWATGYAIVLQMMFFLALGLLLFVFYKGKPFEKANDVYVSFLDYVPTGVLGLVIAAVAAAAIGSMVASLNSMATVFVKDIFERIAGPRVTEKNKLQVARWSTLLFGAFLAGAAILMSKYEHLSALEAISKYGSYIIGSTLGAFILGIYTQRTNEPGVIIGLVVGVMVVALVALFTDVFWLWYNLIGLVATLVVGYGASFVFGTRPKNISMYTLRGQKQFFIEHKKAEMEDGYYVIPGKYERNSYLLLVYFGLLVAVLYALGR
ncbi:MAG TPA: sodium/solute symporter [Spirosoma sp.]|nr:sodium/solute symporter [Spirosoma sp.]